MKYWFHIDIEVMTTYIMGSKVNGAEKETKKLNEYKKYEKEVQI